MALSPKKARFVAEYLKDLSATNAALRAGYTKTHAANQGHRLLKMPDVKKAVDEALARRSERVEVKADDVLRELLRIMRCDIGQAFNKKGGLLPLEEMPEDVRRAISAVEVEELYSGRGEDRVQSGHLCKVKFWDKTKAIELAGKHLKLFTDRIEHSGKVTLEELVTGSMDKPGGAK